MCLGTCCRRLLLLLFHLPLRRHTSRFIICYLTFLPFALWSYLGWVLLPTMVILAFLLLGIENIGIQVRCRLGCRHGWAGDWAVAGAWAGGWAGWETVEQTLQHVVYL